MVRVAATSGVLALALACSTTAVASPMNSDGDRNVRSEGWWMNGTELVLVLGPWPTREPRHPLAYMGPHGGPWEIHTTPTVVTEALLGEVTSGFLEVWRGEDLAIAIPAEGIVFVHRWDATKAYGGDGPPRSDAIALYASEAVGFRSTKRHLHFEGDQVLGMGRGTPMCIVPEAYFAPCEDGETPMTPDEAVAHLRTQLAGKVGPTIPGREAP